MFCSFAFRQCGMLVESRRIRDLLNAPISTTAALSSPATSPDMAMDPPRTYRFSMNPFPAIVIMLLGLMMGAHHQSSTVSTMVHKQVRVVGCTLLVPAFSFVSVRC